MTVSLSIQESIVVPIAAEVIVSLLLFAGGYFIGKYREKKKRRGKNLDEYDFYPFEVGKNNFPEFNLKDFRLAVHYFLKNHDFTAARQLIFIGEQNNVRLQLEKNELREYEKLFSMYNGDKIVDDNNEYLANYGRIVKLLGQTFRDTGIEILLHNLMNPSRSIMEIENGEVTGRRIGMGTTMLVLDLKKRHALHEDKLNYELNIASRKFKCTTIPIFRKDLGLIGAVCINMDINFISEGVMKSKEQMESFFKGYCKTDMILEENILSKEEFEKAQKGKRYWSQVSW